MHAVINIALRAARAAAEELVRSAARLDRVKIIDGSPDSFLTSADRVADGILLHHLYKTYPEHGFQSRVSGKSGAEDSPTQWLIDPLVGNRSFMAGLHDFALSIACQVDGQVNHGVVLFPLSGEEFCASRGTGAQLNSRRLRVNDNITMDQALIGLEPSGLPQQQFLTLQAALLDLGAGIRVSGSAPLSMVHTAAGRLHGGWSSAGELASRAAAQLLLAEAGGLAADQDGNPELRQDGEQLYGGTKMLKQLLKLRRSVGV